VALGRHRRLAADRATILAGISHEVRTPITVIRSAADNLVGGVVVGRGQVADYGRIIERETARLEATVEAALGFARAATPGHARHEVVDLAALVAEIALANPASERITVATEPASSPGDRLALTIAIRNLVANALAYSPVQEPIAVEVRRRAGSVEVAVMDRGPGVPPTERGRVFDPFVRGVAGTASGRSGLGLGLALAHRVAALHRGQLRCADRPGGGSVFTLTLPAS
jgi:signal transduction histidine kinase